MKKKSKLITVILTLAMIVGMTSSAFAATSEDVQPDGNIEKSKTATELNKNDETTVTLKIGAGQETTVSDVVFVLDYSTSTYVRDEALAMLEELYKNAENHIIKVGIINFHTQADVKMELTELNSDSYEAIKEKIAYERQNGGTNMPDGLDAAFKMLEADKDVDNGSKHVVLVSDGLTYQWGHDPVKGVYTLTNIGTKEEGKACDPVDTIKYGYYKNNFDEFKQNVYDGILIPGTDKYNSNNIESKVKNTLEYEADYGDASNVIPNDKVGSTVTTFEVSAVKSAELWQQMKNSGYNLYVFGDERQVANGYVHGLSFMNSLSLISGEESYSQFLSVNEDEIDGLFDNVKSSILYDIAEGTVTDVIGKDFDLIGLDTFKLTVGDKEMKVTIDEKNNAVYFGDAENNEYPYVVKYTAGENEQFKWEINVPVETAKPIQLSYDLKLVNKSQDPGTYETFTNENAVLDYTSSNGSTGSEEFSKPTVSYTVAAADPAPVTPDKTPGGNGPQTSDDFNMLAVCAAALAALLAGTAAVTVRRKRQ